MTSRNKIQRFIGQAPAAPLSAVRALRVPNRTLLELDLEDGLIEYVPDEPVAALLVRGRLAVRDVVEALQRAKDDPRVLGLVARVGGGPLGLAQVEEVRDAVFEFREAGKPAVLFSETFGEFGPGQSGYYLATAFDRIYLQPSGDLGLTGLLAASPFLKRLLESVGVRPRMDHRHEYKSALNLFTEEQFTEPHREALETIARSIYERLVNAIAAARRLRHGRVRELIDRGPLSAREALDARLVDGLGYRDEVYAHVTESLGGDTRLLFLAAYLKRAGRPHAHGPTIALIYGVGGVQRGESRFDPVFGGATMGSRTVATAFRAAIEDAEVRAILFRVDSPGGSYVGSDTIWREVVRARRAGKPVVVSMGNVAGSGGYYVAMAADRIVAQPSTITGSIGVVAGKMVTREMWEKLGITWDEVQVGGNATMWTKVRDYSPEEWQRLQESLDRIYEDFVGKVAEGRGMTPEQVHEVARGRIWSGEDARRLGLVDELGGMAEALRLARQLAGIEPGAAVELKSFVRRRSLLQKVLGREPESSEPQAARALAGLAVSALRPLTGQLGQAGLLGAPGPLTMPDLVFR